MDNIPDNYDTGAWECILSGQINGQPHGQPRGRHVGGHVVSWAAASAPVKLYRGHVERCLKQAVRDAGGGARMRGAAWRKELRLDAQFCFGTPQTARWGLPHTHKPDADNLAKLLMDAMQAAGALGGDDGKIAMLCASKRWGPRGVVFWRLSRPTGLLDGQRGTVLGVDEADLPPWLLGQGEAPA
jgi:Holliday junction resolvase RusA-like endonuclease